MFVLAAADPVQRDSAEGIGASLPNSSQVVLVSGSQTSMYINC